MKKIKAVLFDLDNTLFPLLRGGSHIKNAKLVVQKIKKSKYKTGIVSNCNSHEVLKKIKALDINRFIDVVVTPNEPYDKKPMWKIFLRASKELNVKPSQILFVGDQLIKDIFGAKFCGMKTVLIKEELTTYHKIIFIFKSILGPDFVINDLREVLDVLKTRQFSDSDF